MKNLFTVPILFLLLITNAVAQERVNGVKPTFAETSGQLTSATGWAFNTADQEWVDYPNMISDNKKYKGEYISSMDGTAQSMRDQSFISIQTRALNHKNKKYYVIVVEKWAGKQEYSYSAYITYKETVGYIYTDKEYKKIQNVNMHVSLKTNMIVRMESSDVTDSKLIEEIREEIDDPYKSSDQYALHVMKSTEGKIRFYLPKKFSYTTDHNFKEEYFEIEPENFSMIVLK